jgi:hypothetical protein
MKSGLGLLLKRVRMVVFVRINDMHLLIIYLFYCFSINCELGIRELCSPSESISTSCFPAAAKELKVG